jgi:hypothetical protein
MDGYGVNQDLVNQDLVDSSAPHRCNHSLPELYLYQNEWEGNNDQARCERACPKTENETQEEIRKKARYQSHYRKKKPKH